LLVDVQAIRVSSDDEKGMPVHPFFSLQKNDVKHPVSRRNQEEKQMN